MKKTKKKKTDKVAKPKTFVLVEADGWEALFVNGKLAEQFHSIDVVDELASRGINIRREYAYNDPRVRRFGNWPVKAKLKEIVLDEF